MPRYNYESDRGYESGYESGGCSFGPDDYLFPIGCSSGSYDREEGWDRYEEAFEPVYANRGTQYPCSQDTLNKVQRLSRPNRKTPVCCSDKAVEDMIRYNSREPARGERAALDRLHAAMTNDHLDDWPPDLTIKIFANLDLVFFGGHLLGNTTVEWRGDEAGFQELEVWGCTTWWSHQKGQACISLNARELLLNPAVSTPAMQAWSTLLHGKFFSLELPRIITLKELRDLLAECFHCCPCPKCASLPFPHFGFVILTTEQKCASQYSLSINYRRDYKSKNSLSKL